MVWCDALIKQKYIIFRSKNRRVPGDINDISVNNIVLQRVHSLSFLGVTIDEFLDWKTHIKNVTLKVSSSIGVSSKLKFTVPQNVLMLLYNSIVLPHLSYCNIVWGNSYSSHLNKMEILQKRAIRILTYSMYNSHTKLLFSRMKVLPVQELISLNTCILILCFISTLVIFHTFFKTCLLEIHPFIHITQGKKCYYTNPLYVLPMH